MRRAVRDRGLFDVKKNTNAKTHKVTHDKVHKVQFNTANGNKKVFPAQHNSALRKRRAESSYQSGCEVGAKRPREQSKEYGWHATSGLSVYTNCTCGFSQSGNNTYIQNISRKHKTVVHIIGGWGQ